MSSRNIKNIKLLSINLHGVLGTSKIYQENNGNKLFFSNIQDGMGITLALHAGLKVLVVGDNFYPASLRRAKELKTTKQLIIKKNNLEKDYNLILKEFKIKENEVAWIASDIGSINPFKRAGLKIAIPEAPEEIKKTAHFVTNKSGGNGALREAVEFIVKKQGKWDTIVDNYLQIVN